MPTLQNSLLCYKSKSKHFRKLSEISNLCIQSWYTSLKFSAKENLKTRLLAKLNDIHSTHIIQYLVHSILYHLKINSVKNTCTFLGSSLMCDSNVCFCCIYLCNVIYNSPSSHNFHVLNINITYCSLISYNTDFINDYPFHMSPQPKWILQQTWHIAILYLTFIFLEWICKILALASSLGCGNSIFLSNLPDLRRAGSRISTLLVAAITFRNRNSQFKSLHTMLSLHIKL